MEREDRGRRKGFWTYRFRMRTIFMVNSEGCYLTGDDEAIFSDLTVDPDNLICIRREVDERRQKWGRKEREIESKRRKAGEAQEGR